jgi:hypothetical protein
MKTLVLRKKSVPPEVERILDRSILERFPLFSKTFYFLKKVFHFFGMRFVPFFFINIFHYGYF